MGQESDPRGHADPIWGLGNKKNDLIQQVIERDGVQAYEGSVRYVNAAREAGLRTAIVSSSANTEAVLKAAGVDGLFEVRVDHQVAEAAHLQRQARAGHVPRGGAAARRRRGERDASTRTPWPGWPPGGRGISGSWWAWTGSARPTSCTRTAPTW